MGERHQAVGEDLPLLQDRPQVALSELTQAGCVVSRALSVHEETSAILKISRAMAAEAGTAALATGNTHTIFTSLKLM